MDISVIIPLYNEEESLPELISWIVDVMKKNNFSFEIILVDDGSRDKSWEIIRAESAKNSNVKGIQFRRNYGKSAALHCGFQKAQGDVVITMDADLQDSPDEIPELHRMITKDGFDMVSGWKKKRFDPTLTKRIPSKLYNSVVRIVSGIKLNDFNCGLKAYRLKLVKSIEVYGEMHRFIPVLAKNSGFSKIGEKVVAHQKRKYGTSKFGIDRFINGFLDLLTISFMTRFSKRPMHIFGLFGSLAFMLGALVTVWLGIEKIHGLSKGLPVREITEQPLFYLALVSSIIGVQLFLTGFIAELVARSSSDRNTYLIDEELN